MVDRLRTLAVAAVVAAAAFAGWGGWSWLTAAGDDTLTRAAARDEALRAGREHVARLTTMDYHDVEAGLDRWLAAATGPLRHELANTGDKTRTELRDRGTVATGKVLDAALAELDTRAGTAKMLVSVEITTATEGSEPADTRNRFVARLERTADGWKLSALDPVPVAGGAP